jgi:hypothetical protein
MIMMIIVMMIIIIIIIILFFVLSSSFSYSSHYPYSAPSSLTLQPYIPFGPLGQIIPGFSIEDEYLLIYSLSSLNHLLRHLSIYSLFVLWFFFPIGFQSVIF